MINKIKHILLKFRKHISHRQVAYLGLLTFIVKNPWTILSAGAAAWTGYKLFTTGTYIQSWFSFSAWKDWIWNNTRPTIFDAKEVTSAARQAAQQAIDTASQVAAAVDESLERADRRMLEAAGPEESHRDLEVERADAVSKGEPEHAVYLAQINEALGHFEDLENLPATSEVSDEIFNLLNQLSSQKSITVEDMVDELVHDKRYLEQCTTEEEKVQHYQEILAANARANEEEMAEQKSNAKFTLALGSALGASALILGKVLTHYNII